MKKRILSAVCLLLTAALILGLSGCGTNASAATYDLMENITARTVSGKAPDGDFTGAQLTFAANLLKAAAKDGENALLSPLSVEVALTMTANGADGETLRQMENVLGGGIGIDDLNKYFYEYIGTLSSRKDSTFKSANGIWFKDNKTLSVEKEFLQKNADYFGAAARKAPFNNATLKDINGFIEGNTDGQIKNALDKIDKDAVLYLVNALLFDAVWASPYEDGQISPGTFTAANGEKREVDMMSSTEYNCFCTNFYTGVSKHYRDGWSFVAIKPGDGKTSVSDSIASLNGETLGVILSTDNYFHAKVNIPTFESDCSYEMSELLSDMGMPLAFDENKADFSRMATSSADNICINRVIHKTHIDVNKAGTEASAATIVEMRECGAYFEELPVISFDSPFIYMIVDDEAGIPVFVGVLNDTAK